MKLIIRPDPYDYIDKLISAIKARHNDGDIALARRLRDRSIKRLTELDSLDQVPHTRRSLMRQVLLERGIELTSPTRSWDQTLSTENHDDASDVDDPSGELIDALFRAGYDDDSIRELTSLVERQSSEIPDPTLLTFDGVIGRIGDWLRCQENPTSTALNLLLGLQQNSFHPPSRFQKTLAALAALIELSEAVSAFDEYTEASKHLLLASQTEIRRLTEEIELSTDGDFRLWLDLYRRKLLADTF